MTICAIKDRRLAKLKPRIRSFICCSGIDPLLPAGASEGGTGSAVDFFARSAKGSNALHCRRSGLNLCRSEADIRRTTEAVLPLRILLKADACFQQNRTRSLVKNIRHRNLRSTAAAGLNPFAPEPVLPTYRGGRVTGLQVGRQDFERFLPSLRHRLQPSSTVNIAPCTQSESLAAKNTAAPVMSSGCM